MTKPLQVFLIDDNEHEHVLFEKTLNLIDENIDCYHALSGEDALRMLDSGEYMPDYIFLDLNMPGMNGKECLWELRNTLNVPVIIYTSSKTQRDLDDSKSLGAEWFLVKPESATRLKQSIKMILNDISPVSYNFPAEYGVYKL
jgi:DNA-binding response OmpR family regulator